MRFSAAILSLGLSRVSHTSAFAPASLNNVSRHLTAATSLKGVLTDLVVSIDAPKITKVPASAFTTTAAEPDTTTMGDQPSKVSSSGDITETEVRALFELWNQALATGDSRIVADRYIKAPMLLPTVSDKPRTGKFCASSGTHVFHQTDCSLNSHIAK